MAVCFHASFDVSNVPSSHQILPVQPFGGGTPDSYSLNGAGKHVP